MKAKQPQQDASKPSFTYSEQATRNLTNVLDIPPQPSGRMGKARQRRELELKRRRARLTPRTR